MTTVTGTFQLADDTPDRGTVTFRPWLTAVDDTPALHFVTRGPVVAHLDALGQFSVEVTDSEDEGWRLDEPMPYVVTIATIGHREVYGAYFTGDTVDLADVIKLDAEPSVIPLPLPGPQGPQGQQGDKGDKGDGSLVREGDVTDPPPELLEGEFLYDPLAEPDPGYSALTQDLGDARYIRLSPNRIGNLLTDNQAAVETDLTGFTAASATLARVTTSPIQGAASLQITFTSTGSGGVYAGQPSAGYAPATAGAAHTVVASVIGVSGEPYALLINWYTSAGGAISTSTSATFTANGALQSQSFTAVAPANAARATVYLRRTSGANGSVWKADKFGLWQGAGGQWAMPGTPITNLGTRITRPNTDDRLVEQWNGSAWSVVDYDSGWRSLVATSGGVVVSGSFGSSDWGPHPTSTGGVRIRRVNKTVYVSMLWVECKASSTQGAIVSLPSGFAADPIANSSPIVPTLFGSGLTNVLLAVSPPILYRHTGTTTAGDSFGRYGSVVVSYSVNDVIPTSLPGTLVSPAPA